MKNTFNAPHTPSIIFEAIFFLFPASLAELDFGLLIEATIASTQDITL